ncbi:MAG: hypothetical protein ABIA04_11475, partial [Pseudomonadota bacterium]
KLLKHQLFVAVMKKQTLRLLVVFINFSFIFAFIGCASRAFNISSDPTNAKVYYQTRKDKVFKGYTPITIEDDIENISPSTKVYIEKEGYATNVVNVGGFDGTEISLFISLLNDDSVTENRGDVLTNTEPQSIESPSIDGKPSDYKDDLEFPEDNPKQENSDLKLPAESLEENIFGDAKLTSPPVATPPLPSDEELLKELFSEREPAASTNSEFSDLMKKLEEMEKKLAELKEGGGSANFAGNANADALNHIFNAQRYVQMNKLNEALLETYKAISIDSKMAFAHALQGSIYFLKKDYVSALGSWKKSLEIDPSNMEVLTIYNKVKQRLGKSY